MASKGGEWWGCVGEARGGGRSAGCGVWRLSREKI